MGHEIEHKFLVRSDTWRQKVPGKLYRQGYLSVAKERTVRVRIAGDKGFITIKGLRTGISRKEFEYEIPLQDAEEMLDSLCEKPLIEKIRYVIMHEGLSWEVDEFKGENEGLILAELEVRSEDQSFSLPDWIGIEVSDDPRYSNSNLVKNPYSKWQT